MRRAVSAQIAACDEGEARTLSERRRTSLDSQEDGRREGCESESTEVMSQGRECHWWDTVTRHKAGFVKAGVRLTLVRHFFRNSLQTVVVTGGSLSSNYIFTVHLFSLF